jgi:ZIP family zinc transporter
MTPTAKLALLTLPPVLAACFGALAAAWRAPGPKTSSVIQHFTGGIVLGIAFSASDESGIILTVALTLEVLFLALSVSAALAAAGVGRMLAIVVPVALAALLSIAAVAGNAAFAGLPANLYAALLGLGTVALLYLVTEELLVEAHEVPETPFATAAFFIGFIVFFLIEGTVKAG